MISVITMIGIMGGMIYLATSENWNNNARLMLVTVSFYIPVIWIISIILSIPALSSSLSSKGVKRDWKSPVIPWDIIDSVNLRGMRGCKFFNSVSFSSVGASVSISLSHYKRHEVILREVERYLPWAKGLENSPVSTEFRRSDIAE